MPYPSQIDRESIVHAARDLLESNGSDAIKLSDVADALGVKSPSLYRYFKNKNAVLLAINEITLRELNTAIIQADDGHGTIIERIMKLARAYRQYAHEHPICYKLAMDSNEETRPNQDLQVQLILPIQAVFAELTGDDESLAALRGAMALVHGWVSLENGNQLRRGGDLSAHFERSFRAFIEGWQR